MSFSDDIMRAAWQQAIHRIPTPVGKWLRVNGFDLEEGPDLQQWVKVFGVYDTREAAEAACGSDADPFAGLPDSVTAVLIVFPDHRAEGEGGIAVGPVDKDATLAEFGGATWLLTLDRDGHAVVGRR